MTHDDLIAQLTSLRPRPRRIVAVKEKGREVEIAMTPGRGRWKGAARAIMSALESGSSVEARDAAGGLLLEWSPDLVDVDDAPRRAEPAPVPSALKSEDERMLELLAMLEDRALERSMKLLKPLTDGYNTTLRTLTDRIESMAESNQKLAKDYFGALTRKAEAEAALLSAEVDAEHAEQPRPIDQLAAVLVDKFGGPRLPRDDAGEGEPH